MNILFIADIVPYPPNTGIKIRTFNIIRQLHNGGENRVYLFCFNHRKLIPSVQELSNCVSALQAVCEEVHVFDIPSDASRPRYYWCLLRNIFQWIPYRVARYWSAECADAVTQCVRRANIDLVHLDKTELYRYAQLPELAALPVIATNHNVESLLMRRRATYEPNWWRSAYAYIQYLKTRSYEARVLGEVSAYITCTAVDRDFFRNELHVRTPCAVIDNGVDIERYEVARSYGGRYILIIGAQNKETTANFDATHYFMRDIWPQVIAARPDMNLKIAGRHPDESIVRYGAQPNVQVLGFVEDERELIAGAAMLVVPLRVGGGSRLKVVTTMSMGKPMVSTSIGAEGIECTSGVNIFLADDPVEFAQRINELFGDVALQERMGKAARILAEDRYDWNRIGRRSREFYDGIVKAEAN